VSVRHVVIRGVIEVRDGDIYVLVALLDMALLDLEQQPITVDPRGELRERVLRVEIVFHDGRMEKVVVAILVRSYPRPELLGFEPRVGKINIRFPNRLVVICDFAERAPDLVRTELPMREGGRPRTGDTRRTAYGRMKEPMLRAFHGDSPWS
jgi:hypothetical protein